jgi:hypothetical protein
MNKRMYVFMHAGRGCCVHIHVYVYTCACTSDLHMYIEVRMHTHKQVRKYRTFYTYMQHVCVNIKIYKHHKIDFPRTLSKELVLFEREEKYFVHMLCISVYGLYAYVSRCTYMCICPFCMYMRYMCIDTNAYTCAPRIHMIHMHIHKHMRM